MVGGVVPVVRFVLDRYESVLLIIGVAEIGDVHLVFRAAYSRRRNRLRANHEQASKNVGDVRSHQTIWRQ